MIYPPDVALPGNIVLTDEEGSMDHQGADMPIDSFYRQTRGLIFVQRSRCPF